MDILENVFADDGSAALAANKGYLIARPDPRSPGSGKFILFRNCDAAIGHWSNPRNRA